MTERLQKLIARAGLASRRQAEEWIRQGRVLLNGVPAQLGQRADPQRDQILVDGRPLQSAEKSITVLLNKPRGYLCTLDDPEGRPRVVDLVRDIPQRLFPVGRLDYNTEGLLLLSNDGELTNYLTHPRHQVTKTYLAKVQGRLSEAMLDQLRNGLVLEDGPTAPAAVDNVRQLEKHSWFELTLHEGRNRQVRRMCEALDLTVVRLKRIRFGFLDLSGVGPGRYRVLSDAEIHRLRQFSG